MLQLALQLASQLESNLDPESKDHPLVPLLPVHSQRTAKHMLALDLCWNLERLLELAPRTA